MQKLYLKDKRINKRIEGNVQVNPEDEMFGRHGNWVLREVVLHLTQEDLSKSQASALWKNISSKLFFGTTYFKSWNLSIWKISFQINVSMECQKKTIEQSLPAQWKNGELWRKPKDFQRKRNCLTNSWRLRRTDGLGKTGKPA